MHSRSRSTARRICRRRCRARCKRALASRFTTCPSCAIRTSQAASPTTCVIMGAKHHPAPPTSITKVSAYGTRSGDQTQGVERDHARQRHWLARFCRRSIVVCKAKRMVDASIALFARVGGNDRIGELASMLA